MEIGLRQNVFPALIRVNVDIAKSAGEGKKRKKKGTHMYRKEIGEM